MRTEICAWKQAIPLLINQPHITSYRLAEILELSEYGTREIKDLFKMIYGLVKVEQKELKTKSAINRDYHKKHKKRKNVLDIKFTSKSVASQNSHFISVNNY